MLLCLYARVWQQSREPMSGDNSMSSNGSGNVGNGSGNVSNNSGCGGGGQEPTRTERIQQLRAQHQRRHVERKGQYPLDEREERYEEALRQVRLFFCSTSDYALKPAADAIFVWETFISYFLFNIIYLTKK